MQVITFQDSVKTFILKAFEKKVDEDGFIVESKNPKQKVLAPDGQEVTLDQFAGIKKGSEVFIKSDLLSLLKLCDAIK